MVNATSCRCKIITQSEQARYAESSGRVFSPGTDGTGNVRNGPYLKKLRTFRHVLTLMDTNTSSNPLIGDLVLQGT